MTMRAVDGTAYDLTGPSNGAVDEPVVVLIHGLGLNRHVWQWHEPMLSAQHSVLTYDLCGHGDSAPPTQTPSLTVFAEQLLRLLDELDIETVNLVGFSLGGMINRRFAMDYPERVRSLVILNSPHERSPEAQKLVEERAAKTEEGGPAATLDATIERWFTTTFRNRRPEVIAMVRDWVLANEPVSYAQCRQVLATGVLELIRPQRPITHPTLVMTCENDSGSSPAMSQAIAAEIPGSKTIIVPNLQHMGLCEEPDRFTDAILQFLQGLRL